MTNPKSPSPNPHKGLAAAVRDYLSAIDSEPEKDIWDTWDGKPADGAPKMSSDFAWAEHGQKIDAAMSALRAALATAPEGRP